MKRILDRPSKKDRKDRDPKKGKMGKIGIHQKGKPIERNHFGILSPYPFPFSERQREGCNFHRKR